MISSLVLFDSLSEEGFSRAVEQMRISWIPQKEVIFEKGDDDELSVYLLSGTVVRVGTNTLKAFGFGCSGCNYSAHFQNVQVAVQIAPTRFEYKEKGRSLHG